MTLICSLGLEKYSRCMATSYILTGRASITKMPAMNHACISNTDSVKLLSTPA